VGVITGGALVEREVPVELGAEGLVRLSLHEADFTTATRMTAVVNDFLRTDAASTRDPASPVLKIGALRRVGPQNDPAKAPAAAASAIVQPAKPGVYQVSFSCGGAKLTTKFTVLGERRQVAKVPSGAPQTGGGPAGHGPLAAAGAMGVLAVGGGGLVLARRSRRR